MIKSVPSEYRKFLKNLMKSFRKIKRPISKVIMAEELSSHFNLSPEYCTEIVKFIYK